MRVAERVERFMDAVERWVGRGQPLTPAEQFTLWWYGSLMVGGAFLALVALVVAVVQS